MQNDKRITIAITGHSNSGKTTLLRTLTKRTVGEIRDQADTTKEAELVDPEPGPLSIRAMFARLIDCPGFQHADRLLTLEGLSPEARQEAEAKRPVSMTLDLRAIAALEDVDVVLYIVSLSGIPEHSHHSELELLRTRSERIIGVLNKYHANAKGGAEEMAATDARVQQWRKVFTELGMPDPIVFDAHWDKPAKIVKIYSAIQQILPPEKSETFADQLQEFADGIDRTHSKAFRLLADFVTRVRAIRETANSEEFHHNDAEVAAHLNREVTEKVMVLLDKYITKLAALFVLAARAPARATDSFDLLARKAKASGEWLRHLAAGTSVGAALGALIGAGIGLLSGGLATPALVTLGVQIGGGTGSAVGASVGLGTRRNTRVTGQPSPNDVYQLAKVAFALLWGVSFQGFGQAEEVSSVRTGLLLQFIDKHTTNLAQPNWSEAGERDITDWCKALFKTLEQVNQLD